MSRPRCFGNFGTLLCSKKCYVSVSCEAISKAPVEESSEPIKLKYEAIKAFTPVFAPLPNGHVDAGLFKENDYFRRLSQSVGLFATPKQARQAGKDLGWEMSDNF